MIRSIQPSGCGWICALDDHDDDDDDHDDDDGVDRQLVRMGYRLLVRGCKGL